MAQCQGPRAQMVTIFLVFTYIREHGFAKIPKVLGVARNVNPARTITWLVGITIYCTIFQEEVTSTSPVFTQQNTFETKTNEGKCSIRKLLNLK